MPLRLTTFGGLAVAAADGTPLATLPPRRRLALLAVIAAAGDRGVSRDRLLALFWPDGDEERSRHALTQTLYALSRDLGGAELLLGTGTLRVDPAALTSDVAELEQALDGGDRAAAVALYAGPFLDGVYVAGLGELERWTETERSRLAHRVTSALEWLAADAERRQDGAAAEGWWRRLAVLDPLRASTALGLMRSLAARGDRPAAVRHARVYATLVRSELGIEPDPAVERYAATLATPAAAAEPPPPPTAVVPASPPAAPPAAPPASPTVVRSRRRPWLVAAGVGALVVAGGLLAARAARAARATVARPNEWVLVADFDNATGDSTVDRALGLELATGLAHADRVALFPRSRVREVTRLMGRSAPAARGDVVVDEALAREVAERVGIRLLIVPAVARFDSTYLLSARVVNAATGEALATAETRAPDRGKLLGALDDLAAALRDRLGTSRDAAAPVRALPAATTTSLEALKLFAEWARAFNAGDYGTSEELYRAAIAQDSDFALARTNLGAVYYWVNKRPQGDSQFARAAALLDRVPERERLVMRARMAGARGERDDEIAALRALLQRYPNDVATRGDLAYAYLRARRGEEARALYTRLLATDSTNAIGWINLATVENQRHDALAAVRAYRRAFTLDSSWETRDNINNEYGEYGAALVRAGDLAGARATFRRMAGGTPAQQLRSHRSLAYLAMYEGKFGEAVDELQASIALARHDDAALSETRSRLLRAQALGALGRAAEARVEVDSVWAITRRSHFEPTMLLYVGAAAARDGQLARAHQLLDSARARASASSGADQSAVRVLGAEIAVAEGRAAEAGDALRSAYAVDSSSYVLASAAHAAEARGDLRAALAAYATLMGRDDFGWEGQLPRLLAASDYARLATRLGDAAAARNGYARLASAWARGDAALPVLVEARRNAAR